MVLQFRAPARRPLPGSMTLCFVMAALVTMFALPALAQCDLPAGFPNVAVLTDNDIKVTFASDKSAYAQGETVHFQLIAQNLGTTTFYLNWMTDPQDGYVVMKEGCTALTPPCLQFAVTYFPRYVVDFSPGTTLAPGECRVWTSVQWSTLAYPAPDGVYHVLGGMYQGGAPPDGPGFRMPTGGVPITIRLGSTTPTPTLSRTWGELKSIYR